MKPSVIVGAALVSLVVSGTVWFTVRSPNVRDEPRLTTPAAESRPSALASGDPAPEVGAPQLVALAQRIRTFGRALSSEVASRANEPTPANAAISPPCIYATLNVLARGTSGETRAEIDRVLGTTDRGSADDTGVHALMLALRRATTPADLVLESNTALWIDTSLEVLPEFQADAVRLERAESHRVAFSTPQAALDINAWASDKTHGLIRELFPPGSLDATTVLALTNTIYFRAAWERPFPKQNTTERPFTLIDGQIRTVPTMKQQAVFGVSRTPNADVIELPYRAAGFSMFITLPASDAFLEVERSMNSRDFLPEAASSMPAQDVLLELPRFRVAVSSELGPMLMSLGIRSLFTSGSAFDHLARGNRQDLLLSTLQHGLVVDVTEEQTEAAAATGAGIQVVSPIPEVRVDRPFLFAIVHRPTWTVLFSGRIMDPSS